MTCIGVRHPGKIPFARFAAGWTAAASVAAVCAAPGATAQTASQITPPSFAPPAARVLAPAIIPEGTGATAPAGSDRVEVRLGGVKVEGGVTPPNVLAQLRARLLGRTIKVSEIFDAARALETGYARRGRVLTRVVVPAQSLADGATLRLVVVEGFIERVDVSHVPARARRRVAALLAPLTRADGATFGQLERRLMLAADVPGVQLRSTLVAGTRPGATLLVIEATQSPVTAFASLDNSLSGSLGRYALGVGVNANSVLGFGETAYARVGGLLTSGGGTGVFDATPRDRSLAAGAILPIGDDGLTLNLEMTDARTAARHDAAAPGFGSRFQRASARLRYPLVRSRATTLTAEADFDAEDERVAIIDPVLIPVSLDRLRVFRLVSDLSTLLPSQAALTARAQASFGAPGLGARGAAQADAVLPLSRAGADARFQSLQLAVRLDQPLGRHLAATLQARAQTGFGEVMSNIEQIGVAGADGISTLSSGTLQGDHGYVVRAELRAPLNFRDRTGFGSLSPYLFGAFAHVGFQQPTLVERRATDADAFGVGLRLSGALHAGSPGVSASIEAGRADVDGPPGHAYRLSFNLIAQI